VSKIVASIEARINSTRLPGKMLLNVGNYSMLELMIQRVLASQLLDEIILATTNTPNDDPLEELGHKLGIKVYRGSEKDVLNRVVEAHKEISSDIIVELCGDCPLLDPAIIDHCVELFLTSDADIVSTVFEQSYPQGQDVQVFRTSDLIWVEKNIHDSAVREHVSLYFYENAERYKIKSAQAPEHLAEPNLRLQVDYKQDYELVSKLHEALYLSKGLYYSLGDMLDVLNRIPSLRSINEFCEEKPARI
tara:strand:+ start:6464 stop:7207 length:744 start_codon:yes stop_codon:yes gene_type:complete